MELGFLGSGDHIVHAHFSQVVPVLDVLAAAAVEQDGLLGHDADLGAQELDVDVRRIMTVDELRGDAGRWKG